MARRTYNLDNSSGKTKRGGVLNLLIVAAIVVTFLLVPLFITRSIIFFEPEQAMGVLALIGALVVVLLPLHDRPVKTRVFFGMLVVYIFLYVCWPNYVALDLPVLPFITPARSLLMILLVMWIFIVATSRTIHDRLWQRLKSCPVIWIGLLVLLVFRGLSIPFAVQPSVATKGFFDQITSLYVPLMMAVTLIESEKDVRLLMKTAIIAAFLVGLTVIYEFATETNLFIKYLGKYVPYTSGWMESVLNPIGRNGKYRAQGPFMVHLSMAEFFATTLPFVLYWFEKTKSFWVRTFLTLCLVLFSFAIWSTDSRTSMITGGLVLGIYAAVRAFFFVMRNQDSQLRPVAALFLASIAMLIPLGTAYGFHKMGGGDVFGESGTRGIQMTLAIPKIVDRPIVGYGNGLAGIVLDYRSNGRDPTIDNYYLSVVLDAGLPALFAFVAVIGAAGYTSFRNALRPGPYASLYMAFGLYFMAFALIRSTLSEASNLTLEHVMLGAFIATHFMAQNAAKEAGADAEHEAKPRRRRRRAWTLTRGIDAA